MITVQPPAAPPPAAPVVAAPTAPVVAAAPAAYYAPAPAPAPAYYAQPAYAPPPPVYAAQPAPAPAPAPASPAAQQPISLVINQATNSGEQTTNNGGGSDRKVETKTVAPLEKGQCPSCRVGDLKQHYTVKGLLCALLCFPLGLICCYVWRKKKCNNCAKIYG